jgi:hypothetical protein
MRKHKSQKAQKSSFQAPDPQQTILDDDDLLKDRLLRSLHRNKDGHLSAGTHTRKHHDSIKPEHNAAILYVYTKDVNIYTLHERYVYSHDQHSYVAWHKIVLHEIAAIVAQKSKSFYGVYGWMTGKIVYTPLRNGDLFLKIDATGARGVRISFSARTVKHETYKKARRKTTKTHRSRLR